MTKIKLFIISIISLVPSVNSYAVDVKNLSDEQKEVFDLIKEYEYKIDNEALEKIVEIKEKNSADAAKFIIYNKGLGLDFHECAQLTPQRYVLFAKLAGGNGANANGVVLKDLNEFVSADWQANLLIKMIDRGYSYFTSDYSAFGGMIKAVSNIRTTESVNIANLIIESGGSIDLTSCSKAKLFHEELFKKIIENDKTEKNNKRADNYHLSMVLKVTNKDQADFLISMIDRGFDRVDIVKYLSVVEKYSPEALAIEKIFATNQNFGFCVDKFSNAKDFHVEIVRKMVEKNPKFYNIEVIEKLISTVKDRVQTDKILKQIDHGFSLETILDSIGDPVRLKQTLAELDQMEGLESFKDEVKMLVKLVEANESRRILGLPPFKIPHHYVLTGNPGTGKTTVARLLGKVFKNLGIFPGNFVEIEKTDIEGQHLGETRRKVVAKVNEAKGGVLFIDEAHSIFIDGRDFYGREIIDTLGVQIENNKDALAVILAGYPNEMRRFLEKNPGLNSRFNTTIHLPDYQNHQLESIMVKAFSKGGFNVDAGAREIIRRYFETFKPHDSFGNARFVRNKVDEVFKTQASRIAGLITPEEAAYLNPDEANQMRARFSEICAQDVCTLDPSSQMQVPDQWLLEEALAELEGMIGLNDVKEEVRTLVDMVQVNNLKKAAGLPVENLSHHLIFSGPPGTGKTSVARIIGKIYQALKIVSKGHFVEVGKSEIVGDASKTKAKIADAKGGVLFIDEAYNLSNGLLDSPGEDAVCTLVKEIENPNNDLVVVLAGYADRMKDFLKTNDGLDSRFNIKLEFPDYSGSELKQILMKELKKRELVLSREAEDEVSRYFNSFVPPSENFGNGRFIRNLVDAMVKKQARRLLRLKNGRASAAAAGGEVNPNVLSTQELKEILPSDLPDGFSKPPTDLVKKGSHHSILG